jgi:hypothetical protein
MGGCVPQPPESKKPYGLNQRAFLCLEAGITDVVNAVNRINWEMRTVRFVSFDKLRTGLTAPLALQEKSDPFK